MVYTAPQTVDAPSMSRGVGGEADRRRNRRDGNALSCPKGNTKEVDVASQLNADCLHLVAVTFFHPGRLHSLPVPN
jgi:hypothetical protein